MASEIPSKAQHQLDRFCRQYLQVQLDLDYPAGSHLRNFEFQQSIYSRILSEGAIEYAPPVRYRFRVLKQLFRKIEESVQDWEEEGISDDLTACLSALLNSSVPSEASSAQQKCYVTYTLSALIPRQSNGQVTGLKQGDYSVQPFENERAPVITLLEARNLLSAAGTTGLRTWEASFHLGNYLCNNIHLIRGKSILDLGAGTGYLSILCAKFLGAQHVAATDGSHDVISSLSTNFYLNSLQDSPMIECKELKWGDKLVGCEHVEWDAGRKIDVVLGSDLTYDPTNIPPLVSTFGNIVEIYPEVKIIIAATARNPQNIEELLQSCKRNRYVVEEVEFKLTRMGLQEGPFFDDSIPIQLFCITR